MPAPVVDLGPPVALRAAWWALVNQAPMDAAARFALISKEFKHPALVATGWVTANGAPAIPSGYLARCPQTIDA
jgi:hypothetical protein